MYNNLYQQPEMGINFMGFIWDLLDQWKAVLIAALLMAVLVTGAKYAKDMKGYNAALAEREAEVHSTATIEERIDDVLKTLPEDERSTVMAVVNQNNWIEAQKEYINNSLLINTDPTNQRTLCLDYYIDAEESDGVLEPSIIKGYTAYLGSNKVIKSIGNAIDSEISSNYISELINIGSSDSEYETANSILEVFVVLPENADAEKVEKALTKEITEVSPQISKHIKPHKISLVYSGERYLFNENAYNKRTNTLYNIHNLQNNTKNMQTALSDGQKAAIDSITNILKESEPDGQESAEKTDDPATEEDLAKPGISKKYALLGFILGGMLYAFGYLLYVIQKGVVRSAKDAEHYTQSRLLGEVYYGGEHHGLGVLTHSRIVDKYRYKGKLDNKTQLKKAAESLSAVCAHADTNDITLFSLTDIDKTDDIRSLNSDIKIEVVDITDEFDEKNLIDKDHAVISVGNDTAASKVLGFAKLCTEYDIKLLGCIYATEI